MINPEPRMLGELDEMVGRDRAPTAELSASWSAAYAPRRRNRQNHRAPRRRQVRSRRHPNWSAQTLERQRPHRSAEGAAVDAGGSS